MSKDIHGTHIVRDADNDRIVDLVPLITLHNARQQGDNFITEYQDAADTSRRGVLVVPRCK